MGNLFTIGHSIHEMDYFIGLIKQYHIDYLLDVRTTPYSKYTKQFNKENLAPVLNFAGIQYFFMGKYFGARPQETALYDANGCLDFDKMRESKIFKTGMDNVNIGLCQGHNIALMCTEKHPFDCHRAILIARAFALHNIYAKHILPNGEIFTQQELDECLLQKYFPDRNQLTLFSAENKLEKDFLSDAYKLRNKEIGYQSKRNASIPNN